MAGGGSTITSSDEWRDFVRQMRRSPERLDKVIRRRFRELAADVRDKARSAAAAQYPTGPKRQRANQGHWRDLVMSIQSGATNETPFIRMGGERVPWALGYEFGSVTHRQFPAWRGNKSSAGYFLWPTIRGEGPAVRAKMLEAIEESLTDAFPN